MNIETRLQELRIQWKQNPQDRQSIEDKVMVLKIGQNCPEFISAKDPFIKEVKEALL